MGVSFYNKKGETGIQVRVKWSGKLIVYVFLLLTWHSWLVNFFASFFTRRRFHSQMSSLFPHGLHMPKRMPTNWVLKQIAFPPIPTAFQSGLTLDGRKTPPRISFRNQERIRRACAMASLDPESIGIPSRTVRAVAFTKEEEGKKKAPVASGKTVISKNAARIVAQSDRYNWVFLIVQTE
jgi:hypothetical protein